jgi:hypothetical protein
MTNNEAIVREALEDAKGMYLAPWELAAAIAALDRLVAEPREYRECWHCTLEDKAAMDANLLRVEAERDEARASYEKVRQAHDDAIRWNDEERLAAEARVAELEKLWPDVCGAVLAGVHCALRSGHPGLHVPVAVLWQEAGYSDGPWKEQP